MPIILTEGPLDDDDKDQRDIRLEDMKDDVEDYDFYEEGIDDD